ncbi:MAG: response regulator [Candidatus Cloacimonetes bacterium]|jgi:CheY-like chemotaxis protein|nr:response regulator [Candidatus Cloacimonadota bacterium]MBT4575238.1 response regulator [Candidatus Cloacimonadota bacterium]
MEEKVKVLIVEDEVLIAQWLTAEMQDLGYNVLDFVTSGEEAIVIAKNQKPDVLLLDINLSGYIDGIDAAEKIAETLDIPIIFMTGYNEAKIFERAQMMKPVAYLEKPIDMHNIKPVIESIIKKKK